VGLHCCHAQHVRVQQADLTHQHNTGHAQHVRVQQADLSHQHDKGHAQHVKRLELYSG
jgi:hypothetical protein